MLASYQQMSSHEMDVLTIASCVFASPAIIGPSVEKVLARGSGSIVYTFEVGQIKIVRLVFD